MSKAKAKAAPVKVAASKIGKGKSAKPERQKLLKDAASLWIEVSKKLDELAGTLVPKCKGGKLVSPTDAERIEDTNYLHRVCILLSDLAKKTADGFRNSK